MLPRRGLARTLSELALTPEQRHRLQSLRIDDAGHGWDRFGLSPAGVATGLSIARHLHETYFRVTSHGASNVPTSGPAILASNHSGMLPIDAILLWVDVVLSSNPTRVPRPVADFFVPALPFVNVLFSRAGMITGSRGNVHAALQAGEILEVFPEGVRGIGKGYARRYQLQHWTIGHAELAIRHRAPVVPVAIIGAEEAWPQLGRIEGLRAFGIPYLPVPATPLPLPTHVHLHYGAPIPLHETFGPTALQDAAALEEAANQVKIAVQRLVDHGLATRDGVFR